MEAPGAGTAMRQRCAAAALLAVGSVTLGARQPPARGHRDADAAGAGTFAIAPRTRTATVTRTPFGTLPGGTTVDRFTLINEHGIEVGVMSYGATIMSVRTPDRTGRVDDIVLGFDTLDAYLTRSRYFGAVVGRYGNRIAGGRFTLDGAAIQLTINSGANHLHGGNKGFDKVVWEGEPFDRDGGVGVVFRYTSPDGEESYPGTLKASITYTLTPRDELMLEYRATTDKATPINLTNHSYFNLAGRARGGDILQHLLMLDADRYTPTDDNLIPTGELAPVQGTPFDFRTPTAIGARIDADHEQLRRGKGYDHNFVLNGGAFGAGGGSNRLRASGASAFAEASADRRSLGGGWSASLAEAREQVRRSEAEGPALHLAARVVEPTTGRTLDVETKEPGVQFYAGNNLDLARNGFGRRSGFCLETQHFPDSPNHSNFPSTILRPGRTFESKTVFTFGVK